MASGLVSSLLSSANWLLAILRSSPSASNPRSKGPTVSADLQRLERLLLRIQATLDVAQEQEAQDNYVKLWLKELRALACDAENILDDYRYELLRQQVQERETASSRKRKYTVEHDDDDDDNINERIKEITSRFEEMCSDRVALHLRPEDGERIVDKDVWSKSRPTSHLLDDSLVFGRIDEKEHIVELLLSLSEGPGIVVLPIVGMGGIGKTTLAQMVYNDGRVRNYFEFRGWIHVSPVFDVYGLTVAITESLTKQQSNYKSLSLVHELLVKAVRGKKVFLVLDDLWNEQRSVWQDFLVPLKHAQTMVILATARSKEVACLVQTVEPFVLGSMPKDDSWLLFQNYAFGSQSFDEQSSLVQIGKKIWQKCGGLPLAMKSIGCLLRSKRDEDTWMEILESELWEIDGNDEIFSALRLSYYHLPTRLKPCFLLCSLHPKDLGFTKDEMIHLWIAQGYVHATGCKTPEKVGGQYFDELYSRSLIETSSDQSFTGDQYFCEEHLRSSFGTSLDQLINFTVGKYYDEMHAKSPMELETKLSPSPRAPKHFTQSFIKSSSNQSLVPFQWFKLHDMIYDLAKSFSSTHLYKQIEYITCNVPNKRERSHASKDCRILSFHEPMSLRILVLNCSCPAHFIKLSSFRYLRSLVLNSCEDANNMISGIGNLKHLRYLSLNCNLEELPESLCNLYSLEILVIFSLRRMWPKSFHNLVKLRHLHLSFDLINGSLDPFYELHNLVIMCLKNCSYITELPLSIGNLISLQHLQLVGISSIKSLDHNFFRYHNKNGICPRKVIFQALEELELKDLCKLEDWCGVQDLDCPKLRIITIRNCKKLRRIPYFISLRKLVINRLALTSLQLSTGNAPSLLEALDISDCSHLSTFMGLQNLSSLRFLYIARCRQLNISLSEKLPIRPQYAFIADCPKLRLWCNREEINYFEVSNKMRISDIRTITEYGIDNFLSVEQLSIEKCPDIDAELLSSTEKWLPSKLRFLQFSFSTFSGVVCFHRGLYMLLRLEIRGCTKLESLEGLDVLVVLRTLFIADCPLIDLWPGKKFPPQLSCLVVRGCHKIRSVDLLMAYPSMLMELEMSDCQGLMYLAGLMSLSNLESLRLIKCPLLELRELLLAVPETSVIFRCPRLKKWCEIHCIEPLQESIEGCSSCGEDF